MNKIVQNLPALVATKLPATISGPAKKSLRINFTAAAIKKLVSAPDTPDTLIDAKQPGLILLRSASGRWDYRFEKRIDKRLYRKTICQWTDTTDIADVRTTARELVQKAAAGSWDSDRLDAHHLALTTKTWAEATEYHIVEANLRQTSARSYRGAIAAYAPHLPKAVGDLSGPLFKAAFDALVAGGRTKVTATAYASALTAIWSTWAFQWDITKRPQHNPISNGLKTGPRRSAAVKSPPRTGRLTKGQIPVFLDAARKRYASVDAAHGSAFAAVEFCLLTGLRLREVLNLSWKETDGSWLHIPARRMKGKANFSKPIGPAAAQILARQRDMDRVWVFPSVKSEGPITSVSANLTLINADAGTNVRMHDLRRSFISSAKEIGMDSGLVKRLVAHSVANDVTEQFYTVGIEDLLQEVANKIEAAMTEKTNV